MPILRNKDLNLEKHVFPVLQSHGKRPRWISGGDDGGDHEGIRCMGGYVSICSGNHLYVQGTEEFAEFLLEYIRPFGDEHIIHLYPVDPEVANRLPQPRTLCDKILGIQHVW